MNSIITTVPQTQKNSKFSKLLKLSVQPKSLLFVAFVLALLALCISLNFKWAGIIASAGLLYHFVDKLVTELMSYVNLDIAYGDIVCELEADWR